MIYLHSWVSCFLEMLDCCLRKNGVPSTEWMFHASWPKGRNKHMNTFHPSVQATIGTVSSCCQECSPPLPPEAPVRASKQGASSLSTCAAYLLCIVCSPVTCIVQFHFPFPHPSLHSTDSWCHTPGWEVEWRCFTLDSGICSHTILLTRMWLSLC